MKSSAPILFRVILLVCHCLSIPLLELAQGVLLRPGQVFEASFSSMRPGSHDLQVTDRPVWELNGTLTVSRVDLPFSFHVDLINGADVSPFWSYNFVAPSGSFGEGTGTFGAADIGSPWTSKPGTIRVRFLSGPPVTLTELRAYQSFLVGGTYRSYEAIITVPEPSVEGMACVGVLFVCSLTLRRSKAA